MIKKLVLYGVALAAARATFCKVLATLKDEQPSEVDELVAEQQRIREEAAREDRILKRILIARREYEGNPKVWN